MSSHIFHYNQGSSGNSGNSGNSYSLGNSKPLINREQNYVLDRKLLTVHSEDRDITKWPNSNTFEIMLPETLLNVQSMRLIQATMPAYFFTFSNDYQNTAFQFTIQNVAHIVTIQEGNYTPCQLSNELTNKMNRSINSDASFNVFYDEVKHNFWFGHTDLSFNLDFDKQITYNFVNCEQPIIWNNHSKWGFPYYIGFKKQKYQSTIDLDGSISFDYICPNNTTIVDYSNITNYIEAPLSFSLGGETSLYLEIDKYNSYDELYPYNESSTQLFGNNAYSGKVNSAFAKIPIREYNENTYDSRTIFLVNMVHYDPPIERIARLKFRFRFHDGRLVNFQNFPFDFTLEFNSLRNEIEKKYNVRIPSYVI
jgi:hypothetical protein